MKAALTAPPNLNSNCARCRALARDQDSVALEALGPEHREELHVHLPVALAALRVAVLADPAR